MSCLSLQDVAVVQGPAAAGGAAAPGALRVRRPLPTRGATLLRTVDREPALVSHIFNNYI